VRPQRRGQVDAHLAPARRVPRRLWLQRVAHDALAARGWVETPADFPEDATKDATDAPANAPANAPKGLAASKAANNKPAQGTVASGMPASGLPAMGHVGTIIGAHRGPDVPRRTREGLKFASMAAMEAALDDPEVPAVAKALVAEKLLNRLEGMPTQMTVTADMGDVSNLSAEEREAEMEALERKLGRA
jgi:hypothetical protein